MAELTGTTWIPWTTAMTRMTRMNVFLQSGLETLFFLGLCDILMLGTKSHRLNLLTRIDIDFCQTGTDFIYSSSVKLGNSAIFTFSILSKISDKPYTQAYQSH